MNKMKNDSTSSAAKCREFVVLAIVPGIVGALIVLSWALAHWGIGPLYLNAGLAVLATLFGGWQRFLSGFQDIFRRRRITVNVFITVALVTTLAIGEFRPAAIIIFIMAVVGALESYTLDKNRQSIRNLLDLTPQSATVRRGQEEVVVPVEEIQVGTVIIVKPGERVPVDGVVVGGASSVNQAPITGESMPVEKKSGETVFAGTINGEGSLEVKVTKASTDTTLAKIIKLVGEAQSQKAPSQRFVDRFAKIYTPAVFVVAILVLLSGPLLFHGAWLEWAYRALVLLVIACPCALVISTPVSIVSGLTAMARRGVLIKGGVFLEEIGELKALAVDKTGTITEGKPRIQQVIPWNHKSEEEILRVAAAIDTHSQHPLAQAVVKYAEEKKIQFPRGENYQSKTGRGAEARIDGHLYFVGNHRYVHELGLCTPELERQLSEIEAQAQSVVVVGHQPHDGETGDVFGILAIGDTVRANARAAIALLHQAGVKKIVMLSGDNQRTADAIAKQVGIDESNGNLLPDDKIARVRELTAKYKHVGMIGDGVNDAPALAQADVGFAMGAAGTDTAIETADTALMQDDLSKVAETIALGRRTVRMIQTNIAFALGVKAIFLALAITGHATLWMAILADTGATLIVIANALRLLRPQKQSTSSSHA